MALLKETAELKEWFSGIDHDYNFKSIVSFRNDAESDYIIPEIGREMYDVVNAAYNDIDTPISGKLKDFHLLLQKSVAHFTLMLSADSGAIRISDSGMYVKASDDQRPVSDKKLMLFRKGRREAAYKALEQAIDFLIANIDDAAFVVYKSSDQYLAAKAYFINTAKEFTRYFKAINNSAITFRALLDSIGQAERTYLLPVLGDEFFDHLKSQIKSNQLSDHEVALMPYICRPLAYYAIGEAVPVLPIEFDGTNLFISSMPAYGNSENIETKNAANESRLSILMNNCIMNGEKELQRLKTYLSKNASKFDKYKADEYSDEDYNINNMNRGGFFL